VTARKIVVTGRVQGVGYRPFVYVTAHELGIRGTVLNGSGKVFIHAEGGADQIEALERALLERAPPLAKPRLDVSERAVCRGVADFRILSSDDSTVPDIHVPPDLYTCDDCLGELSTKSERRFGYPFINCTQCGPRYTIITDMPYDRPNTSMRAFALCADCRAEYESPLDRRFHAQPLACPVCGPQLSFTAQGGNTVGGAGGALRQTIEALQAGQIIAVKGVGGYHLVCDAASDAAVSLLRERKNRPDKPLAVMFPVTGADGLDSVREFIELDETTSRAILDPARAIVLAPRRPGIALSEQLAPGLAELGVFLPYSPLHHVLLQSFGRPIVATSGNISGEPVITDNEDAEERLARVADAFLHHDRPIVRPADDPVLRPIAGHARAIRLGRGIAPLERRLEVEIGPPTLALGGHMKVTIALAWKNRVVISPHIGDLDSVKSNHIFQKVIEDIQNLYDVKAERLICDLHPRYASSRWALAYGEAHGLPVRRVQHHAAHASSLAGEHPDVGRWLMFAWDGVGYGGDGELWGGEALAGSPGDWRRVASFRPFRLLGGDRAGREPWRSAAALMWADGPDWSPHMEGADLARRAWDKGINTHETSAVGRLFDAAAALVMGRTHASFEGQGPMELEQLAWNGHECEAVRLPLALDAEGILRADWAPLLPVLADTSIAASQRAEIFHRSMAATLTRQAMDIRARQDFDAVGLSGGVFQNRRLPELAVKMLAERDIELRLHREVPANDGGLSFGQVIEQL
jgi:hydrogenase maturation protein HypF